MSWVTWLPKSMMRTVSVIGSRRPLGSGRGYAIWPESAIPRNASTLVPEGEAARRGVSGEGVDGGGKLLVDDVEIFGPVVETGEVRLAVADAAKADGRHTEAAGGAEHGKRLHVDHIGADRVVAGAGDDGA